MSRHLVLPTPDELAWMEPAEIEAALVAAEHARRLAEAALIDVLDAADRERVWATDGHRSVKNWAVAISGISPAEAGRRCQTLRALRHLDEVRERLRAGEVGVCQVRELAMLHANRRVRQHLTRAEPLLVGIARRRGFDDFHRCAERWRRAADPDGASRTADEAHRERSVRIRFTDAGFTLSARGGRADGIELVEILEAFADAELAADRDAATRALAEADVASGEPVDRADDGLARTWEQRRFDALAHVFATAARAPATSGVRVPTVDLVCDLATFEDHLAHAAGGPEPAPADPDDLSRRCETVGGVAVDPRDVVVAALVGHVRRVLVDAAGVVVDAGRRRRLFTGAGREVVWVQGTQCLWPGCGLRAHEQDHTIAWAHEGATAPANSGPACGLHNRWKSHGYTTRRDDDGVWHVHRPDGSEITEPRAA